MVQCAAEGCSNSSNKKKPGVSFFRFPKEEYILAAWIKALGRDSWQPTSHSRLCSAHFGEDCMDKSRVYSRLRHHAVPTIFQSKSSPFQKAKEVKMVRQKITARKETPSLPKSKKCSNASTKKENGRNGTDILLSDEDTLPSGTDAFENSSRKMTTFEEFSPGKDVGSSPRGQKLELPARKRIAKKKSIKDYVLLTKKNRLKTSDVKKISYEETLPLGNDSIYLIQESDRKKKAFTVEDPKKNFIKPTVPSGQRSVDFNSALGEVFSKLRNQESLHESECEEIFEMTTSIDDIKKEPEDYKWDIRNEPVDYKWDLKKESIDFKSDFDSKNSISKDLVKDRFCGKILLEHQIKKEALVKDDIASVPPCTLFSNIKTDKCSEESKTGHPGRKSVVGKWENGTFDAPEEKLNRGYPKEREGIKAENHYSYNSKIVNGTGRLAVAAGKSNIAKSIKIKEEPVSDHEDCGSAKGNTKSAQMLGSISRICFNKNDSKPSSVSSPDLSILSTKIKEEPLSDSKNVTDMSYIYYALPSVNGDHLAPAFIPAVPDSYSTATLSHSTEEGSWRGKEIVSGTKNMHSEIENLIVTSASDEYGRKNYKFPLDVTSGCVGEVNIKKPGNSESHDELSSTESVPLNSGTSERLNLNERQAAEIISGLPEDRLQELIQEIAEGRKLDLKAVNDNGKIKEREHWKNGATPLTTQNAVQQVTNLFSLCQNSITATSSQHVSSSQARNALVRDKTGLLNRPSQRNEVGAYAALNQGQLSYAGKCNLAGTTNSSENKAVNNPINLDKLVSSEDLHNILRTVSNLETHLSTRPTAGDRGCLNHPNLANCRSESSNGLSKILNTGACEQNKNRKLFSAPSTEFHSAVIKTAGYPSTQEQQPESAASTGNQRGVSLALRSSVSRKGFDHKGSAGPGALDGNLSADLCVSAKQDKENGATGIFSEAKDKFTTVKSKENGNACEYPDAKKCEIGKFDDYNEVSMDCSEPSENENDLDAKGLQTKRNLERSKSKKNKRLKTVSAENNFQMQSAERDEICHPDLQKCGYQKTNSVSDWKFSSPETPSIPSKNIEVIKLSGVKGRSLPSKRLEDSVVKVIQPCGINGKHLPSKWNGIPKGELDQSELGRNLLPPEESSLEESSRCNVKNSFDVATSKTSNKNPNFISRNKSFANEMIPGKRVCNQSRSKYKWFRSSKNESTTLQEGHSLTKKETSDVQPDSESKGEILMRGSNSSNPSLIRDPRLNPSRGKAFVGKREKLNVAQCKEKCGNTHSGSPFQTMQLASSTNDCNQNRVVFQTGGFRSEMTSRNPQSAAVQLISSATRKQPSVSSPPQPFIPNPAHSVLPMRSLPAPQNLPNVTSAVPAFARITRNPVQLVPPSTPDVIRNVPVQLVHPLQNLSRMPQKALPEQNLRNMTQSVSSISPLLLPNVPPPLPVDALHSSFQGSPLRNSLDGPPPLPPPYKFSPPPPLPPNSPPEESVGVASTSPPASFPASISPPTSDPPVSETRHSKTRLQPECLSPTASTKTSIASGFLSSDAVFYPQKNNSGSSSAVLYSPEQPFPDCLPSESLNASTSSGIQKIVPSAQHPASSEYNHRVAKSSNQKFSSKSALTFNDMANANSSSEDLLFLLLSWSVRWLPQQIQIPDPPPITEKVMVAVSSYGCYKDYYDTYFTLFLHEIWETIFLAWRQEKVVRYFCSVNHHKPEGRLHKIHCDTVISNSCLTNGRYPAEGYLVIIKFRLVGNSGSTEMYGYVSRHSVRPFDTKSDLSNPCLKHLVPERGEEVSVLSMCIKIAAACDRIDFSALARIQLIHPLQPQLKQYDALLNLRFSPLCNGILSPDSSLCTAVSLSKLNSSKQKSSSSSAIVEEIASFILKPHSVPQIIVVEALPGTDKVNLLVKLLHYLKSSSTAKKKTRILFCSRTNEVVDEAGCHLILSQERLDKDKRVQCVRLGKLSDIHPKMREFSLESLLSKEVNRVKNLELEHSEREYQEAYRNFAQTQRNRGILLKLSLQFAQKLEKQLVEQQRVLQKKQTDREKVLTRHDILRKQYLRSAQSVIIEKSDVILSTVACCYQLDLSKICGNQSDAPLDCCIIDDASQCTEIETLLPLFYGMSKLVLLGDPNISARVLSKTASSCNYDLSYFQRVFNQIQIR